MGSRDRRQVLLCEDADRFAGRAADLLRRDPIGTNVPATVLAGVRAGRPQPAGSLWAVVCDVDRPTGVALLTSGFPAFLSPMPGDDAAALAEALHRHGVDLPDVRGDAAAVAAFAARWQQLTGHAGQQVSAEGVHVLGELVPPDGVPGSCRTAGPDDEPLVARWYAGFEREAHPEEPDPGDDVVRQRVALFVRRIATGGLVLWTDPAGTPVSLAGWQLPDAADGDDTGRTGRIGPVWTPPEHRRRGYAAAVTAAATRSVLAAGAAQVMLYTDLANPTSNGVYARLGYRRVGDAAFWTFTAPAFTAPAGAAPAAAGPAGAGPAVAGPAVAGPAVGALTGPRVGVRVLADARDLGAAERAWLAADPVRTNAIGAALAAAGAGEPSAGLRWLVAERDGLAVGVALLDADAGLLHAPPLDAGVPEALAAALHAGPAAPGDRADGVPFGDLIGDAAATEALAAAWADRTGAEPRRVMARGIHVLHRLVPPRGVPGRARTATPDDAPLVAAWLAAFSADLRPDEPATATPPDRLDARLAAGRLLLWEADGVPVAIAGWHPAAGEPGRAVVRVGTVYTVPEHRRRGFAAAVTAAATRRAAATGAAAVMLHTDLANPTSNGIYARLGYRLVGEGAAWSLRARTAAPGVTRATSAGR